MSLWQLFGFFSSPEKWRRNMKQNFQPTSDPYHLDSKIKWRPHVVMPQRTSTQGTAASGNIPDHSWPRFSRNPHWPPADHPTVLSPLRCLSFTGRGKTARLRARQDPFRWPPNLPSNQYIQIRSLRLSLLQLAQMETAFPQCVHLNQFPRLPREWGGPSQVLSYLWQTQPLISRIF